MQPYRHPCRDDLAKFPIVMSKHHMAEIFGKSVRWVEKQVADGTFPIPRLVQSAKPAWSKGRVIEFFERETSAPLKQSA